MARGSIHARLVARNAGREDAIALVGGRSCRHPILTYGELFRLMDEVGAGLLELGLRPRDHVALISENCDLWIIASLGITGIGAVDVPRGGDAPPSEILFCVEHGDCRMAVVETKRHAEMLRPLSPRLDKVIVLRGEAPEGHLTFDEVVALGRKSLASHPERLRAARESIRESDLCTIIYTSGTTGNPKGVMLTHGNILHNIRAVPRVIPFEEGGRFLSFLPSWHSFERTIEAIVLDHGMQIHYGSKRTLKNDFLKVKPSFVVGVPRIYELFQRSVLDEVHRRKGILGFILRGSLEASRILVASWRRICRLVISADGRVPRPRLSHYLEFILLLPLMGLPHLLAWLLVYRRMKSAFGGRLQAAVSGGGALADHVDEFLTRAGLPLLNGYGLTETSPVLTVRRLECNRLGSIGRPLPETEIRIVDEEGRDVGTMRKGVIQARGPQVMKGYYKNEAATREALTEDGWFDTGDTGMLSSEGDLMIFGRVKETIVLTGGENVEPEPIENLLLTSPYVADAVLVGHCKKTLGVLIVPAPDALRERLELSPELPDEEIARLPETHDLLKAEVARIIAPEKGFRTFERIARVAVLERPFTPEDGSLTQSLKKRRSVIEERHADLIRKLYGEDPAPAGG